MKTLHTITRVDVMSNFMMIIINLLTNMQVLKVF